MKDLVEEILLLMMQKKKYMQTIVYEQHTMKVASRHTDTIIATKNRNPLEKSH